MHNSATQQILIAAAVQLTSRPPRNKHGGDGPGRRGSKWEVIISQRGGEGQRRHGAVIVDNVEGEPLRPREGDNKCVSWW